MINKFIKNFKKLDLQSISGLDAAFLYAETPTSPMHVGMVGVVEGDLEFETFKATIHSRIHQIPKLRKRLMYVPFSIDYPYWVDDPNFDIDMHLFHIALPKPGDWSALRQISSKIFSSPLDQSRPLWSVYFVEGLDNIPQVPKGSVALISKVHHVAIDGVAGAGLLSILFDMTPTVKEIPPPRPYEPEPLPDDLSMIMKSTMSFAEKPLKLPTLVRDAVTASFKAGMITRAQRVDMPSAPFTAPQTPINGIISSQRKWNTAILSLQRVKALKKIMGTTLNDVVLAICAGALRRYFEEKGQLPIRPLVAMIPISTRTQEEANDTDNQIASMLVQIATNVDDPIERLLTIQENTERGKTYQEAVGAKTLAKMAEVVPFGIANQAAQLYSRYQVAEMHNPVMNLTITNVPGPQFPLYINGHKLLSIMGMAPIIDGMGLIITVLSYNGLLTMSPTSDVKSMPDLDVFTRYLRESANELETAVLKHDKKEKKAPAKKAKPKAQSDKLFSHLRKELKASAQYIKPNNGIFHFQVKGDVPTDWTINLDKTPGTVRKGKPTNSDVTITIEDQHLMRIGRGELNFQTAFIQGRLKMNGDSAKAMKLASIMSKLPKMKG